MARFKFRLEKVLEVKEIALKQEQRRLSEIGKKRHQLLQQREQLERTLEECSAKINTLDDTHVNLLSAYYTYLHQIMQEIRQLEDQMYQLDQEELAVQNKLREVQKEKKILQKLKDKNYQRFVKEQQEQEQAILDELALFGGVPD